MQTLVFTFNGEGTIHMEVPNSLMIVNTLTMNVLTNVGHIEKQLYYFIQDAVFESVSESALLDLTTAVEAFIKNTSPYSGLSVMMQEINKLPYFNIKES